MNSQIKVVYKAVPEKVIEDFESNLKGIAELSVVQEEDEHLNFTGSPSDIIIYINQHLTELIASGLIGDAAYDLIKQSLKAVWKKFIAYSQVKKTKISSNKKHISLQFSVDEDKSIEFVLIGDLDESHIAEITHQVFAYLLDSEKQQTDFSNRNLIDNTFGKPRIQIRFNEEAKKWEPVDFHLLKKQWDGLVK